MQEVDFILISDLRIWSISVEECHEPLVNLQELDVQISLNRASFYDGYTKVRQTVAHKLLAAKKHLPPGVNFLFSEGHRPISLQQQMYHDYYNQLQIAHPDWNEATLKRETCKYIAPPEDVPPHSTGGAIDITLIDANGEIDMGSVLDETPDKNENRNFTFANNIPAYAKTNRKILYDALSKVGFVNYPAEWWHWSYGDKYWAYHKKKSAAIFGSVG